MPVTVTSFRQFATALDDNCAVQLQTNLSTVQLLLLRLEIENTAGSNTYSVVHTFAAPPDANKRAVFYIADVLRRYLSFTWPSDLNATTNTAQLHLCKRYRIATAELLQNQNPTAVTYTTANTGYAVLAGKGFVGFATQPDVKPTLANGTSELMTSRPLTRRVSYQQAEHLMLLRNTSGTYNITCVVINTDNTTSNINISYTVPANLQAVLVPVHHARITALTGKIARTATLTIDANTTVTLQFYDDAHRRNAYHFHYETSAGSIESLICHADIVQRVEFESEELRHYVPFNYTAAAQEYRSYNQIHRAGGTAYSQYLTLAESRAAIQALKRYNARLRFRTIDESFQTIPVNINGAYEYSLNGEPQGIQIDYQHAFKER